MPTNSGGWARCRCVWRRRTCRSRLTLRSWVPPPDGGFPSARYGPRSAPASSTRSAVTCGRCPGSARHPPWSGSTSRSTGRSPGCPRSLGPAHWAAQGDLTRSLVRGKRVSPGHLVAVATGPSGADVAVWRWYDAVVLASEDDGSARLWEPAHGEVVARARDSYQNQDPGSRAYASAGLPGADWWVAGSANGAPQPA